jgi:hypothetical protein
MAEPLFLLLLLHALLQSKDCPPGSHLRVSVKAMPRIPPYWPRHGCCKCQPTTRHHCRSDKEEDTNNRGHVSLYASTNASCGKMYKSASMGFSSGCRADCGTTARRLSPTRLSQPVLTFLNSGCRADCGIRDDRPAAFPRMEKPRLS